MACRTTNLLKLLRIEEKETTRKRDLIEIKKRSSTERRRDERG